MTQQGNCYSEIAQVLATPPLSFPFSVITRAGTFIKALRLLRRDHRLADGQFGQVQYAQPVPDLRYRFDAAAYLRVRPGVTGQALKLRQRVAELGTLGVHEIRDDAAIRLLREEDEVGSKDLAWRGRGPRAPCSFP